MEALSRAGVASVAAGGWHSAAITAGCVAYIWGRGRAVQVDPIIPTLKARGTQRLKPLYNDQLSNVAFSFNLRRYNEASTAAWAWATTAWTNCGPWNCPSASASWRRR